LRPSQQELPGSYLISLAQDSLTIVQSLNKAPPSQLQASLSACTAVARGVRNPPGLQHCAGTAHAALRPATARALWCALAADSHGRPALSCRRGRIPQGPLRSQHPNKKRRQRTPPAFGPQASSAGAFSPQRKDLQSVTKAHYNTAGHGGTVLRLHRAGDGDLSEPNHQPVVFRTYRAVSVSQGLSYTTRPADCCFPRIPDFCRETPFYSEDYRRKRRTIPGKQRGPQGITTNFPCQEKRSNILLGSIYISQSVEFFVLNGRAQYTCETK
jgi:hypothetical protein